MPGTKVGGIYYDLDLDDKKFEQGMDNASRRLPKLGQLFKEAERGSFALLGGLTALGASMVVLGSQGVQTASEIENVAAAFKVMLKDGDKAQKLLKEIQAFAASTPFEFPELASAGKKLLAYGFAADDVITQLRRLGDVASGLNIPLNELTDVYGKARVQGRLFMEDINQLQGRGIPIVQELAKKFKVNETAIREMVTEGKVGFGDIEEAFKNMSSEGGIFFGGMEAQSKTLSGLISTLSDNFNLFLSDLIVNSGIFDFLKRAVDSISKAIGDLSKAIDDAGGPWAYLKKILDENQQVIYIVAGAIMGGLVPAFVALAASIWATVAPLAPFLLAGGAIGYLVNELVNRFGGWEPLITRVNEILQNLWKTFQQIWNILAPIFIPILTELFNVIRYELWPALQALWVELEPKLMPVLKLLAVLIGGAVIGALIALAYILVGLVEVITQVVKAFTDWLDNLEWRFNQAKAQWDALVKVFEDGFNGIKYLLSLVPEAFQNLVRGIETALSNVWNAITQPFRDAFNWLDEKLKEARENLDKLNPFHRESPSIVDWISRGTEEIKSLYGNMFNDLDNMALNNRTNLVTGAQIGTGQTGKSSNETAAAPVSININMSGIMARSRGEIRDIGEELIGAVNEGLRAKGKPQIGI